jgi:hypothetical protein
MVDKEHATWIRILETMLKVALEHGAADADYYSQTKPGLIRAKIFGTSAEIN